MQRLLEQRLEERVKTKLETENEVSNLPKNASHPSLWHDIKYLFIKLLLAGVAIVVLLIFIFGVTRNNDLAMNPAVKHGDLVFYFRLDKEYLASDLVALSYNEKVQIYRVVAVEGDVVEINENGLLINGRVQQEPEIIGETLAYEDGIMYPLTLEKGEVFLLGDNRELSKDSRFYGAIEVRDTLGKVMLIMRRRNL